MLRNNGTQNSQNVGEDIQRRSEPDAVSSQESIKIIPQSQTQKNSMSLKSCNKRQVPR